MNKIEMQEILTKIDVNAPVPMDEHNKQYYYIRKMQDVLKEEEQKLGHKVTACINTFGCPMVIVTQKCGNPLFI